LKNVIGFGTRDPTGHYILNAYEEQNRGCQRNDKGRWRVESKCVVHRADPRIGRNESRIHHQKNNRQKGGKAEKIKERTEGEQKDNPKTVPAVTGHEHVQQRTKDRCVIVHGRQWNAISLIFKIASNLKVPIFISDDTRYQIQTLDKAPPSAKNSRHAFSGHW
jgi:hypothetical protein